MYIEGWAVLLIFFAMSLITWLAIVWNKTKTPESLVEYHLDHAEHEQHVDSHGDDL